MHPFPVRCRHSLLPEPWGLTGEQLDGAGPGKMERMFQEGERRRAKVVTASLCLRREFCFQTVKGFININWSLFCWAEMCYRGAQGVGCALPCCVNVKYSESRDAHGDSSTALNMYLT